MKVSQGEYLHCQGKWISDHATIPQKKLQEALWSGGMNLPSALLFFSCMMSKMLSPLLTASIKLYQMEVLFRCCTVNKLLISDFSLHYSLL